MLRLNTAFKEISIFKSDFICFFFLFTNRIQSSSICIHTYDSYASLSRKKHQMSSYLQTSFFRQPHPFTLSLLSYIFLFISSTRLPESLLVPPPIPRAVPFTLSPPVSFVFYGRTGKK